MFGSFVFFIYTQDFVQRLLTKEAQDFLDVLLQSQFPRILGFAIIAFSIFSERVTISKAITSRGLSENVNPRIRPGTHFSGSFFGQ